MIGLSSAVRRGTLNPSSRADDPVEFGNGGIVLAELGFSVSTVLGYKQDSISAISRGKLPLRPPGALDEGEFLEYGINISPGILSSSRKHILTETGTNTTNYKSVFVLKGWLSPLVGFLVGSQLRRGFNDMTSGIAERAEDIYASKSV